MRALTKYATVLLLALPLAMPATAQQVSPIKATLVIPDAKLLPGVPFDMWIDVANPTDTEVTIGLFPTLVGQRDGERFEIVPAWGAVPDLFPDPCVPQHHDSHEYLQLAPGEKQTLLVRGARPFFTDVYALMPPGHYTISFRIDAHPDILMRHVPTPITYHGPVVTSSASFERILPSGADAKVWELMQKASADGRWMLPVDTYSPGAGPDVPNAAQRFAVFQKILTDYPDSNYFPYALGHDRHAANQHDAIVRDAIRRFPNTPVFEGLHLGLWRRDRIFDPDQQEHKRVIEASKRPTTRFAAFGREGCPKQPCPPDYDCEDDH